MTRSPKSFASPLRRGRRLRRSGACARCESNRVRAFDDPAHVEGFQPPTSPHREVQTLNRSSVSSRRCAISSGFICSRPEQAVVLCVDENSQIQALDRPQPLLTRPAPAFLSTGRRGEGAIRGREAAVDELAPGRRARAEASQSIPKSAPTCRSGQNQAEEARPQSSIDPS